MVEFLRAFLVTVRALFRTRTDAAPEVLALRQQVAVLKRKRPRPRLKAGDRLFWTALRRFWPRWSDVLLIVQPETVIGWHRAGFRLLWRQKLGFTIAERTVARYLRRLLRRETRSGRG